MTRQEEIDKQAKIYADIDSIIPAGSELSDKVGFREGAQWADKHPREGLVDIEKACDWLEKNVWPMTGVDYSALTESFYKAMED